MMPQYTLNQLHQLRLDGMPRAWKSNGRCRPATA
jgi:hypothetical protein